MSIQKRIIIIEPPSLNSIMDWESAKKHCTERNWNWSLAFIAQAEKEMQELEGKLKKHEDQQKANRLYNSCNY